MPMASEYLRRRHFKPLVNFMLDLSLSDSDRLRFVHETCGVVRRGVGSLAGFGGCTDRVRGEDMSRVQGVPKKVPTRNYQKSCAGFVQAASRHHPSCVQARSICIQAMFKAHARSLRLQRNLCVAAPPKCPLYNIKEGKLVQKHVFCPCPVASRILPRHSCVPEWC